MTDVFTVPSPKPRIRVKAICVRISAEPASQTPDDIWVIPDFLIRDRDNQAAFMRAS